MFLFADNYKKIGRHLAAEKPLIIFNAETTGKSITEDKIVSLAYVKIRQDGLGRKDQYFFDPGIRVRAEAAELHGLTNAALIGFSGFKERARELYDIFSACRYSGFNISNFDLPILRREFLRVGIDFSYEQDDIMDIKDVYRFFAPHTFENAYEYYCHRELKGKKDPLSGIEAQVEVLIRQLEKYRDFLAWNSASQIRSIAEEPEADSPESNRKFYWQDGRAFLSFSKYSGQPLDLIAARDPEFVRWLSTADFSREIKMIAEESLEKCRKSGAGE